MSELHYIAILHNAARDRRRAICETIGDIIRRDRRHATFPCIKYEAGKRGQYYLALAVNLDESKHEDSQATLAIGREILARAGIRNARNEKNTFLLNDGEADWMKKNYECSRFTHSLKYEIPDSFDAAAFDDCAVYTKGDESDAGQEHERLLYWCSAAGSGSFNLFQKSCRQIVPSDSGGWSTLRRYILLGHLDHDARLRWGVVPPALLTTANGEEVVLTGQRTPALVDAIGQKCVLAERSQRQGPLRLAIPAEKKSLCAEASGIHDVGCVSHKMAGSLPSLEEWKRLLRENEWEVDLHNRYQISRYDLNSDKMIDTVRYTGDRWDGLYRLVFDRPFRRSMYVLFEDGSEKGIIGDFYGLRFLARKKRGLSPVWFQKREEQLVIMERERWPLPYERALVLAGGLLPRHLSGDGQRMLIYEGVTRHLAERLCRLLELEMEERQ